MLQRRELVSIVAAGGVTLGLFVFSMIDSQRSSGQRMSEIPPNRKPACTIFCGDSTFNTIALAQPPACWGGPLPAGSAGDSYKEWSKEDRKAICKNLASSGRTAASCPAFKTLMAACEQDGNVPPGAQPTPTPKCDPPAQGSEDGPWNRADCKSFQDVLFRRTGGSIVVSACGQIIGKSQGDALILEAMQAAWPKKICCDKLSGPRDTACDYSVDLDCDGTPNGRDDVPDNYSGEETFYNIPAGTKYDPLPKGLRLSDLLPDIACDGCKWELVKGDKKCTAKSSGTGLFWYEATWKCPKTGMEVWRPSKRRLLRQRCT